MRIDTRRIVLAAGTAACLLAPPLMIAGVHSPVRVAAALLLVALAPGAAALPWLAPRGARVEIALLVAASLGFCAVAAEAMLWLHVWDPTLATCALAALCLVGITGQVVSGRFDSEREWSR